MSFLDPFALKDDVENSTSSDSDEEAVNADTGATKKESMRYPTILRANRQVYNEAVSILYTETILCMEAGAIFCLRPEADLGSPSKKIWKHNPLEYHGETNSKGNPKYNMSILDGRMEPHVFARFERIEIYIDLDLSGGDLMVAQVEIDENFNIDADDIKNYTSIIRRTNLFKDLAIVLARSPVLKSLQLDLSVEVDVAYPMNIPESEDEDEDDELDTLEDQYMLKVNNLATDILIESGLLDPFKLLSNIEMFDLKASDVDILNPKFSGDMYRKLAPRTARVVQELKQAIERKS